MSEMEQYREMFVSESREHLNLLNQKMLELEKNPSKLEILSEIFRSAHTIKGMSATMGYQSIASLSHGMENLLETLRRGARSVDSNVMDALFECLDLLEGMIEEVAERGTCSASAAAALSKLDSLLNERASEAQKKEVQGEELSEGEKKALESALQEGLNCYRVYVELHPECALKSVRAFMVFKSLSAVGRILKSVPGTEEIENGKFGRGFSLWLATKGSEAAIKSALDKISELSKIEVLPVAGEKLAGQKQTPNSTVETRSKSAEIKSVQSVRVPIERLDKLMNLVGELVIGKSRLFQIGAKHEIEELNEALFSLSRLTTDLQDEVTRMRMVEAAFVFDRFPRMVRDLAKAQGKEIELTIEGKEIELDRTVLDEIGDPLVHLLRNSVDHGIEPPEERRRKGKPEKGTLKLVAKRQKNHVEITVEDDGRGIDPRKMREVAVNKGLKTREEAAKLSDAEAQALVYLPGFSTAEKVTDVSGRGVGMDVVRTKILSLGGTVELKSEAGKGTKTTLQLPLTLAIVQALLVRVREEIYAVPLSSVAETLNVKKEEIKSVKGREVILLRGNVIPFLRLSNLVKLSPNGEKADSFPVVVVEQSSQLLGLAVNELIGKQEIVIKSFDPLLRGTRGFAGATILGDGRVALILDMATLIKR